MAGDSTAPSWHYVNSDFEFTREPPVHVPRAWERAPHPSHLARHKGRKVWKRPEARGKEDVGKNETSTIDDERNPLRDVSSNTPRPVKRLRVKDGIATGSQHEGGDFANYFATLREGSIGTPKRKYATLELEKPHRRNEDTEEPDRENKRGKPIHEDRTTSSKNEIEEDLLRVLESCAQADVRDLLDHTDMPPMEVEKEMAHMMDEGGPTQNIEELLTVSESVDMNCQPDHTDTGIIEDRESPEMTIATPQSEGTVGLPLSIPKELAENSAKTKDADKDASVLQRKTPVSVAGEIRGETLQITSMESPKGVNSPQIGATLLRRESLRSKGSPRKRGSAKKNASPHGTHGLKKRDTLQEREILQQFNAASSPSNSKGIKGLYHEAGDTSPSKPSPSHSTIANGDNQHVITSLESHEKKLPLKESADIQVGDVTLDQTILKDKDVQRAIEAVQVCQNPNQGPADAGFDNASISSEAIIATDQSDDFMVKSELDKVVPNAAEACEKSEVSTRKTRSVARISDDTSMLQDFLNRAQAKKAAKNVPVLSAEVPSLQSSPTRRSPRKALEPQNGNIGSPHKKKKSTRGPSTPPRKVLVEENDSSDDQEIISGPTSFRRSTRIRFPAPSKTPPGAPTFIPVRRGEGSDQIVLQKSQAQEMAIVTRANTRRNKGQSKPPALALQELPPESPIKLTSKDRADYAKKVAWAERLASFQESKDTPEEPEEQRPKVRRMRGLGAVNGTPAKKSTLTAPSSNGTPAPKRRSKTK